MLDFDFFAWLDGASPWWWIALALALGAVEIVTFTYFMLWLGLAAFTVAVSMWVFPEMPGTSQLGSFALLSLLYTGIGWAVVRRRLAGDEHPSLNRRAAAVIGRQGIVTGAFAAGMGVVEVDGVRWRARLADGVAALEPGTTASIVSADGMTVVVRPLEAAAPG